MRAAVPVEKRVSTSLWRLATGDCYRKAAFIMYPTGGGGGGGRGF